MTVALAANIHEVREAQRLRYRVFAEEMGARVPGREQGIDCDIYDAYCHHLLVRDQILLRVVPRFLPVGVSGFFLGGCLATAMSTVDSYVLIAAGNVVYDIYRPLSTRALDDRTMIRYTRIAMVFSGLVSVLIGLYFERIKEAWNFMATVLTSTLLVPMGVALLAPGRRLAARRAGPNRRRFQRPRWRPVLATVLGHNAAPLDYPGPRLPRPRAVPPEPVAVPGHRGGGRRGVPRRPSGVGGSDLFAGR